MDKREKLLNAYNRFMAKWWGPESVKSELPTESEGFVVGEMDNFLCDANFAWYRQRGIRSKITCVCLYYDIDTDKLKVVAFINKKDTLVGTVGTNVDEVIDMFFDEHDEHKAVNIMIDAVDRYFRIID